MTDPMDDVCPRRCRDLAPVGGALRASDDDFRVDEIASYEPCGEGEHTYLRFEKRDMTTPYALAQIARSLKIQARDIGYAGMKDRHAVTTQTVSLPRVEPERAAALDIPGLRVLSVARHRNKLRTGHLRGNRFALRVRDVPGGVDAALARARYIAEIIRGAGVPNYFGEQRFGREGDNAARARSWLSGGNEGPRDPQQRRFLVSALQSELFNAWLGARVRDGLLDAHVEGDLAARGASGRPWAISAEDAALLYASNAASPTGPMFGRSMERPTGEADAREEAVLAAASLDRAFFDRIGPLAEGTRRPARVFVEGLEVHAEGDALRFCFTLAPGAYATVVMREFGVSSTTASSVETGSAAEHPTTRPEPTPAG
jgi:tRNA pseudouridine13 synthase